jgi:transposase
MRGTIPPDVLTAYMLEHGIDKQEVADRTASSIRSVYRWIERGIPRAMFELLKIEPARA